MRKDYADMFALIADDALARRYFETCRTGCVSRLPGAPAASTAWRGSRTARSAWRQERDEEAVSKRLEEVNLRQPLHNNE